MDLNICHFLLYLSSIVIAIVIHLRLVKIAIKLLQITYLQTAIVIEHKLPQRIQMQYFQVWRRSSLRCGTPSLITCYYYYSDYYYYYYYYYYYCYCFLPSSSPSPSSSSSSSAFSSSSSSSSSSCRCRC